MFGDVGGFNKSPVRYLLYTRIRNRDGAIEGKDRRVHTGNNSKKYVN